MCARNDVGDERTFIPPVPPAVASVEAANRLRAEFAELTGNARIMSIEVFEVVLHEVPRRVVT